MKTLDVNTRTNLQYLLGMSLDELDSLNVQEEFLHIETKLSSKISFSSKRDTRKTGRGNPLLARRRFRTMEDVNKGLDKIK